MHILSINNEDTIKKNVLGLSPGKYLGCFRDSTISRLLNGAYYNCSKQNSQTYCINKCLQGGFPYAGVQFS